MSKHKPQINFIGIGDQKSATTWIFECLKEHPNVCGFKNKETRFFDNDYLYNQGLDKYKEFFNHCADESVIGEYSPSYIHSKEALERIKRHYPDIKILISFRDPVKKMFSEYRFNKISGTGAMMQYESFIEAVKDREDLLERAKHGKSLQRVYEFFDQDQVFVGLYDDLKENPKEFIQDTYSFLEIDDSFEPDSIEEEYNATGDRRLRSKMLAKLIASFSGFIKNYKHLKGFLEKVGGRKVYNELQRLNNIQDSDKNSEKEAALSSIVESEVRGMLKEDIEELETITGRGLSEWKL